MTFAAEGTELAKRVADDIPSTKQELEEYRKKVARTLGLGHLPSNTELIRLLAEDKKTSSLLRVKPTRTASGIAVVAVMPPPHPCPHGVCIYCPGGVSWGTPQSYTGYEPAAMRAQEKNFDPYLQVASRLDQLRSAGHEVGKCELVLIGGTFTSMEEGFQEEFVKRCLDALNGFDSPSLEAAKIAAEHVEIRNVGLTVETKPDWCKQKDIDVMLSYGTTRVELGVQGLDDDVYRIVNRGHTVQDVIESFQAAKDSGLKIVAHMMPGLPGSSPEKDMEGFRTLFEDPCFRPDMLKIYPCLVIEGTALYGLFKRRLYTPYDESVAVSLLAEVKRSVPEWVRIMRIQREIPAHEIVAGVKSSNLRQLVLDELRRRGDVCRCIRCREVGLVKGVTLSDSDIVLFREDYDSSGGREIFLSYEDRRKEVIIGFLRLRQPSGEACRPEVAGGGSMMVRELRVYGSVVPVGRRDDGLWQHKGYGSRLMFEAERIAQEEFDASKILVISALGTRGYYRRFGYELDGPYMSKKLLN